jgi:FtsZ-interacting cell division protein ZipA
MATDNHPDHHYENSHRRLAVGVEEFAAGKKGVTRAIQEYKHRKDRKVRDKAILIRSYNKVKKREGYQRETKPTEDSSTKRRNKSDPLLLTKSRAKAEQQALDKQRRLEEQEKREKQTRENLKKRRHQAQLMKKRTKKGQPVMSHVIHNILDKLQKDE